MYIEPNINLNYQQQCIPDYFSKHVIMFHSSVNLKTNNKPLMERG